MAPTTRPANDRKRSCLMAGPRTTSSRGTGASISCCTTGASKVSGPPRPPERRPKATATAMSRPSTAGPWSMKCWSDAPWQLGLVDLAGQEDHEDDAGRGGQVDVVERVDPVDALEPVVTPCSPQVLERASGGGVGHHDRPIYRSRPEPRNRPACVPCDGDPRRPRPRVGQPTRPAAVRGPVAHPGLGRPARRRGPQRRRQVHPAAGPHRRGRARVGDGPAGQGGPGGRRSSSVPSSGPAAWSTPCAGRAPADRRGASTLGGRGRARPHRPGRDRPTPT